MADTGDSAQSPPSPASSSPPPPLPPPPPPPPAVHDAESNGAAPTFAHNSKKKSRLQWDEDNLTSNALEMERAGPRMKIDEPNTPFAGSENGSSTSGSAHQSPPGSPAFLSADRLVGFNTLEERIRTSAESAAAAAAAAGEGEEGEAAAAAAAAAATAAGENEEEEEEETAAPNPSSNTTPDQMGAAAAQQSQQHQRQQNPTPVSVSVSVAAAAAAAAAVGAEQLPTDPSDDAVIDVEPATTATAAATDAPAVTADDADRAPRRAASVSRSVHISDDISARPPRSSHSAENTDFEALRKKHYHNEAYIVRQSLCSDEDDGEDDDVENENGNNNSGGSDVPNGDGDIGSGGGVSDAAANRMDTSDT